MRTPTTARTTADFARKTKTDTGTNTPPGAPAGRAPPRAWQRRCGSRGALRGRVRHRFFPHSRRVSFLLRRGYCSLDLYFENWEMGRVGETTHVTLACFLSLGGFGEGVCFGESRGERARRARGCVAQFCCCSYIRDIVCRLAQRAVFPADPPPFLGWTRWLVSTGGDCAFLSHWWIAFTGGRRGVDLSDPTRHESSCETLESRVADLLDWRMFLFVFLADFFQRVYSRILEVLLASCSLSYCRAHNTIFFPSFLLHYRT
jgi:hypothetical protein